MNPYESPQTPKGNPPPQPKGGLPWVAIVLALLAFLAGAFFWLKMPVPPQ